MSIELMARARKVKGLDPTAKLLLMFICDHADHHGTCWPSIQLLADDVGVSTRSVQRQMKTLEEAGFLFKDPRLGRSTIYTIVLGQTDVDVRGDDMSPPGSDRPEPPSPAAPTPDTHVTHNHQEPSTSPTSESKSTEVEVEGQGEVDPDQVAAAIKTLAAAGLVDEAEAMKEVHEQLGGGEPEPEPEPGGTLRDQMPPGFAKDQEDFDAKVNSGEAVPGVGEDDDGRWV